MATDDDVQALLDVQTITSALHAYARAMDRLDRALGYSVFWPDATVDYGEQMYAGTGHGFVDMVMEAHLHYETHSHRVSNIQIRVDGDTAASETYCDAVLRHVDHRGGVTDLRTVGRYVDRWERRGGEWRILDRTYVHDLDQTTRPEVRFPTTGRRDSVDPSYRGVAAKEQP